MKRWARETNRQTDVPVSTQEMALPKGDIIYFKFGHERTSKRLKGWGRDKAGQTCAISGCFQMELFLCHYPLPSNGSDSRWCCAIFMPHTSGFSYYWPLTECVSNEIWLRTIGTEQSSPAEVAPCLERKVQIPLGGGGCHHLGGGILKVAVTPPCQCH